MREAIVISGGRGSGKTTFMVKLVRALDGVLVVRDERTKGTMVKMGLRTDQVVTYMDVISGVGTFQSVRNKEVFFDDVEAFLANFASCVSGFSVTSSTSKSNERPQRMGGELGLTLDLSAFVEIAADLEHRRWAGWQGYLHEKCKRNRNGSLTIPKELVKRWERQMATNYNELTEPEKESDRKEVRKYLNLIAMLRDQDVALLRARSGLKKYDDTGRGYWW